MTVKFAIADENPIFRRGLYAIIVDQLATNLSLHSLSFTLAGEADATSALVEMLAQETPDILLLGYHLRTSQGPHPACGMDGLALLKWITRQYPLLKVIMVSPYSNPQLIRAALKAGAHGYITRNVSEKRLIQALVTVAGGEMYIERSTINAFFQSGKQSADELSPREMDVLRLLCRGLPLVAIARQMHLSIKTVSAHKLRAMEKLHVASDCHLYCLLTTTRMFDIAI